jgi:hypothetical protein
MLKIKSISFIQLIQHNPAIISAFSLIQREGISISELPDKKFMQTATGIHL